MRIREPIRETESKVDLEMQFQIFEAQRGTYRMFRLVLKNRGFVAQIQKNRGFISACFKARPENPIPHLRSNVRLHFTNVVSDFQGAGRNITLNIPLLHPPGPVDYRRPSPGRL